MPEKIISTNNEIKFNYFNYINSGLSLVTVIYSFFFFFLEKQLELALYEE